MLFRKWVRISASSVRTLAVVSSSERFEIGYSAVNQAVHATDVSV
jgi:hypothetical protein